MSDINKDSLIKILESLNGELKSKEQFRTLKVFGSGALMLLNLSNENRFTHDLDMLSPTGDMELLRASEVVAKKFKLNEEWLNSIGHRFARHLPVKWEERLQLVFSKSNLEVYALSNVDLFFTKIRAYYDRGTESDLEDLMSFNFTISDSEKFFKENHFSDKKRTEIVLKHIKEEYEKGKS